MNNNASLTVLSIQNWTSVMIQFPVNPESRTSFCLYPYNPNTVEDDVFCQFRFNLDLDLKISLYTTMTLEKVCAIELSLWIFPLCHYPLNQSEILILAIWTGSSGTPARTCHARGPEFGVRSDLDICLRACRITRDKLSGVDNKFLEINNEKVSPLNKLGIVLRSC